MLKKRIKWFGIDCGSADHSMNTSIRMMRPDIAKRFEQRVGATCEEFFGDLHLRPQEVGPPGDREHLSLPQLRVSGGFDPCRERWRRHREGAEPALSSLVPSRGATKAWKHARAASSASWIAANRSRLWATSPRRSCRAGRDCNPCPVLVRRSGAVIDICEAAGRRETRKRDGLHHGPPRASVTVAPAASARNLKGRSAARAAPVPQRGWRAPRRRLRPSRG